MILGEVPGGGRQVDPSPCLLNLYAPLLSRQSSPHLQLSFNSRRVAVVTAVGFNSVSKNVPFLRLKDLLGHTHAKFHFFSLKKEKVSLLLKGIT